MLAQEPPDEEDITAEAKLLYETNDADGAADALDEAQAKLDTIASKEVEQAANEVRLQAEFARQYLQFLGNGLGNFEFKWGNYLEAIVRLEQADYNLRAAMRSDLSLDGVSSRDPFEMTMGEPS
jgi:hypothetical protein